jgi:hypothetical protein
MERKHNSFLLRCWWRKGGLERVEIEHIQSGERELASSVAEAVEWICAHGDGNGKETPQDSRDPPLVNERTRDFLT